MCETEHATQVARQHIAFQIQRAKSFETQQLWRYCAAQHVRSELDSGQIAETTIPEGARDAVGRDDDAQRRLSGRVAGNVPVIRLPLNSSCSRCGYWSGSPGSRPVSWFAVSTALWRRGASAGSGPVSELFWATRVIRLPRPSLGSDPVKRLLKSEAR